MAVRRPLGLDRFRRRAGRCGARVATRPAHPSGDVVRRRGRRSSGCEHGVWFTPTDGPRLDGTHRGLTHTLTHQSTCGIPAAAEQGTWPYGPTLVHGHTRTAAETERDGWRFSTLVGAGRASWRAGEPGHDRWNLATHGGTRALGFGGARSE